MSDLGKKEMEIKPDLSKYLLLILISLIVLSIALFFPSYWDNWVWIGIPVIWVAYIAAPLLIILLVVNFIQSKKSNEFIEIYERGLRIGEFFSVYNGLSLDVRKGFIDKVLIFENDTLKKKFKYPIKNKDLNIIIKKLKDHHTK